MTTALMDGDILLYRTGFASEDVPERIAKARLSETLGNILEAVQATTYRIFLSDSKGNFRLQIFPNYKANRTQQKPTHHDYLSNILVNDMKAEIAWGEEADDALGIHQTEDTVICSIDKDLHQIPGRHFNWVTGGFRYISNSEALYRFYSQVLIGDSTDNITVKEGLSCPGIGKEKAYQALEGCITERDYVETVSYLYRRALEKEFHTDIITARLLKTGQLVYVRRKEGEIWTLPTYSSDVG